MPVHPQRTFDLADTVVGEALLAARRSMAFDQRTAAGLAGIDWRVLSRIERGERPCRVTELVALAETYQIAPDVLISAITGDEKAWVKVLRDKSKRT